MKNIYWTIVFVIVIVDAVIALALPVLYDLWNPYNKAFYDFMNKLATFCKVLFIIMDVAVGAGVIVEFLIGMGA